jgi:hypothetical protein
MWGIFIPALKGEVFRPLTSNFCKQQTVRRLKGCEPRAVYSLEVEVALLVELLLTHYEA